MEPTTGFSSEIDYCDKFPDIRGMLTELTESNWSERLRELTSSFLTMDLAEIRKTEEAEPSGAITRTKAAMERAEIEEKSCKSCERILGNGENATEKCI
jgi:hypothetical protein